MFWSQNYWNYTLLTSSSQQITIQAKNVGGLQLYLTVAYGSNWQKERKELLSQLVQINQHIISGPWSVSVYLWSLVSDGWLLIPPGSLMKNWVEDHLLLLNCLLLMIVSPHALYQTWNQWGLIGLDITMKRVPPESLVDWIESWVINTGLTLYVFTWLFLWVSLSSCKWPLTHVAPSFQNHWYRSQTLQVLQLLEWMRGVQVCYSWSMVCWIHRLS